jgi:hypothetical protein
MLTSAPGPKLAGYDLAPPTEADAVAALTRVFGPDEARALWANACAVAGVNVGQVGAGAPLERATQSLAAQGGAAATVARSIAIRMRTYTQLAARAAATSTGARQ